MSRIVVFGAGGKGGSRIVAEAASRGHEVTAVVRDPERAGELPDGVEVVAADVTDQAAVAELGRDADALVVAVGGPGTALYTDAVAAVTGAARDLGPDAPLIIHMGGGASLLDPDGVRYLDHADFPDAYRENATAQGQALDAYRKAEDVRWTYLSPPPVFFAPGERTGSYRTGDDHPVAGEDGQARISYEDFAVAVVDEAEEPKHVGRRFTVGY